MAPIIADRTRIKSFPTAAAFADWMSRHHGQQPELWLKVHKKDSGLQTVTVAEALDVALCWGWIDSTRKSFDGQSFLQRYSPRGARKCVEPDQSRLGGAVDSGRPDDCSWSAARGCRESRWPLGRRLRASPQRDRGHHPRRSRAAHRRKSAHTKTFQRLNRQHLSRWRSTPTG